MRPFVIGKEELDKLAAIKKYAEENPFSMDDHLDVYNKEKLGAGHTPHHRCIIPVGFLIIYSIDTIVQEEKEILVRHLSVQILQAGSLPSPAVVSLVMAQMGFTKPLGGVLGVQETDGVIHVFDYYPAQ